MDASFKPNTRLHDDQIMWNVIDSIDQISSSDWNSCVSLESPFLKHQFLQALENSGCVSPKTGWLPQHIVIRNSKRNGGRILGVAPMYLKGHSLGEYIFDWDWAAGLQQYGFNYYPKLVSQIPFTPVSSSKLLAAPDTDASNVELLLAQAGQEIIEALGVSSMHWLFISEQDRKSLDASKGISRKSTIEYIWENRGYASMKDFLSQLSRRKRKNINQERKYVDRQGISIEIIEGEEMNATHWKFIERCYTETIRKYGSFKYLSYEFFRIAGEMIPQNFVLFLARQHGRPVASSICLQGGSNLIGRYWGSVEKILHLHFEICYYSPIEYCIDQGLAFYNAGIQGEHKLSRGFLPRLASSYHSFNDDELRDVIREYVNRESKQLKAYQQDLMKHSAYQKTGEFSCSNFP